MLSDQEDDQTFGTKNSDSKDITEDIEKKGKT